MPNIANIVFWRKVAVVLVALVGAVASVRAEDAGRIIQAIGEVRVGNAPAYAGDVVRAGDALSTGVDGYLYIKTVDGGFLILRPASVARVVEYRVDGAQPQNSRFKIELEQGIARSISGEAVKGARHEAACGDVARQVFRSDFRQELGWGQRVRICKETDVASVGLLMPGKKEIADFHAAVGHFFIERIANNACAAPPYVGRIRFD